MKIFVYFVTAGMLFVLYVWYLENTTIFLPSREMVATPLSLGLPFEDIYFKANDHVTLNGWLVKPLEESSRPRNTLIYLHGNGGNISDRVEKVSIFAKLGLNVFIVDYRGYGKSHGKPTEAGIYLDALGAYDYLMARPDIDKNRIIAYGVSLGGAAAVELALKRTVAALIVDSTFTNAKDMAKVIFPFVPSFLIRTQMDSLSKIKSVPVPKLFIHSKDDEMIPFKLGFKLYEAAPDPKEFLEIKGSHNEGYEASASQYWGGINAFLEQNNFL